MKATVIEIFQDKYTRELYSVGQEIDVEDSERLSDLVARNLVEVAEKKEKAPKKTTAKK